MQTQQEQQHWVLRKTEFLDLPIVKTTVNAQGGGFLSYEGGPVWVLYLMKRVLEQKGQELHHRELGVGFNSSQMNTHKEPQKVSKLLNVAT